jgi:hypothetical protein
MGWGFYELSGGADFQPPAPVATAKADTAAPAPTASRLAQSQKARAAQTRSRTPAASETPQVVLASLAPDQSTNKTNRAPSAAQVTERAAARNDTPPATPESPENRVFSLQDMVMPPPATNAANPNGIQPVRPTPARTADMREIVASSVNMRAGPGTSSDILMRLGRGDSVEVLEDSGTGWLRLRALPQDRVGWIAARLVSPASD